MARVLLIDDDFKLLRLYAKMLEAGKHVVVPTTTIQAAREMLRRGEKFDVGISDVQVGLVDPTIMLHDLGMMRTKYHLPILVISAHMEKYQKLCDEYGLITLPKPFSQTELVTRVNALYAASLLDERDDVDATMVSPSKTKRDANS